MSDEEVRRAGVLKRVKAGDLTQVEAAEVLGLSYRQLKRLYRRFRKQGRWMLAEGLWSRERKRKPYRQRRARRAHFGELVQMDESFENWLEERGPRGCLIHMVDDATSTSLATFAEEETTWGVADTLRAWVIKFGVPRALYVDWKKIYHHESTRRQKEEGIVPISQFGRMCGGDGS